MRRIIFVWGVILTLFFGQECLGQQEEDNNDYQYALIEAVKQKNLGNLSEAVKLYRLVIKERPDCEVAYYELGGIYLMSNQVDLAISNLKVSYELDPNNKWYVLIYLSALEAGKQYEEMETILKDKIHMEPEEVDWEYRLATVYFNQDKHKKALRFQ